MGLDEDNWISVVIFAITFGLAMIYVKGLGVRLGGDET